jgi:hypothetical protein
MTSNQLLIKLLPLHSAAVRYLTPGPEECLVVAGWINGVSMAHLTEMTEHETAKQLSSVIGTQFAEYQVKVSEHMLSFLDGYKQQLEGKFDIERQALLQRIRELEALLNSTGEVLHKTTVQTERQDHLLDLGFGLVSGRKTSLQVVRAWADVAKKRKRTSKMTDYCDNFFTRGVMRRVMRGWKQGTDMQYRSRTQKAIAQTTVQATAAAKAQMAEELGLLRTMVEDLTEDLRHETLAKENLQYMYEQALLRGMTALNVESLAIHQSTLEQARGLHETSKQLLFTPQRFSPKT